MNDTAQETTTATATLVEQEVLGVPLLPVEGEQKKRDHTKSYSSFTPN